RVREPAPPRPGRARTSRAGPGVQAAPDRVGSAEAARRPEEVAAMSACTVRFYQKEDVEGIHAAALESVTEVYPWMAWCHARYTLDEAREWVMLQIELARQRRAFEFVIVGDGGRLLGRSVERTY